MIPEEEQVTYLGEAHGRGKPTRFGIKEKDRSRHIYVIGQTGTGKSTLLENMAIQDINNGGGLVFMDPHGQAVDSLLNFITPDRLNDTIYFAPHDQERPIALNIMEDVGYDKRHLVVSSLIAAFRRIWGETSWSDRMEYILSNTLLALLEYPDTTLLDVGRMYTNKDFRERVIDAVKDPQVRSYWRGDFARYTDRYSAEATPAIQNKIGQFTSNPLIRNIIGQPKSAFSFRDVIDTRKILLINLSKGTIGDTNARLLGVLFSTKLYLATLSRADLESKEREALPPSNFYVDEFQSFASSTFAEILSEARKYKLNLVMAHQYIAQLDEMVRDAVFGNVGTLITFRIGPLDAELVEKQFTPVFKQEDLIALPRYHMYLVLNIDNAGSRPFSAYTVAPPQHPADSQRENVLRQSREQYGTAREDVEGRIGESLQKDWQEIASSGKGGGKGGGSGRNNFSRNGPPSGNGNHRSFSDKKGGGNDGQGVTRGAPFHEKNEKGVPQRNNIHNGAPPPPRKEEQKAPPASAGNSLASVLKSMQQEAATQTPLEQKPKLAPPPPAPTNSDWVSLADVKTHTPPPPHHQKKKQPFKRDTVVHTHPQKPLIPGPNKKDTVVHIHPQKPLIPGPKPKIIQETTTHEKKRIPEEISSYEKKKIPEKDRRGQERSAPPMKQHEVQKSATHVFTPTLVTGGKTVTQWQLHFDPYRFFKDRKVVVMGLGTLGRQAGDIAWLARAGAHVLVTDLQGYDILTESVEPLRRYKNITFRLGGHAVEDFVSADFILTAAAVPKDNIYLAAARKAGIPIIMSAAFFAQHAGIRVIGITGTEGKSTVTAFVEALCRSAFGTKKVLSGGNKKGISNLQLFESIEPDSIAVFELDAWQLQGFGTTKMSPTISVFTNFADNYMDYYQGDSASYFTDMANSYAFQKSGDILICDASVKRAIQQYDIPSPARVRVVEKMNPHLRPWVQLRGDHQLYNASLAYKVAEELAIQDATVEKAFRSVRKLPGRLEKIVSRLTDRVWYNDSAATTPQATIAALNAIPEATVLILGGADKKFTVAPLVKALKNYHGTVLLLPGSGSDKIANALSDNDIRVDSLEDAVDRAVSLSKSQDTILFSPGFAPFGTFQTVYHRDEAFRLAL